MKKYYVCVQAGNEGVYIKATDFEWNEKLKFIMLENDEVRTIAVFKNWEYFLELEENDGKATFLN